MAAYDSLRIRPWEALPGDRILGMPGVKIEWSRFAGRSEMGDDVGSQRYEVRLSNGRSIVYGGDSHLFVLRDA